MIKDKKQKKIQWQQYIGMLFFIVIGAICGFFIGKHLSFTSNEGATFSEITFSLALLLIILVAAVFLQIVIHEAGHLIFGLLTNYRFSSFRIGSFMLLKEDGKLKFKRLSIAGMGGQCLMVPPDMSEDKKIPFALYNMGGSFLNIFSSLSFLGLYLLLGNIPYLSTFFLLLSVVGVAFALLNGIPMQLGVINNDGYNVLSLGKNKEALRSFWVMLKVNEQISRGIRLKDMPKEWFIVPEKDVMKNSMTAVMGVLACNRLMDNHLFMEADHLMDKLLNMDSAIVGLHRNLMMCDRIYCELIGENREDNIDAMLDKQQKKFMKSMKNFPSVLRTEYSYVMLKENDLEKSSKIKEKFEKCAHTYPYSSDIDSERELMEIVDSLAKK